MPGTTGQTGRELRRIHDLNHIGVVVQVLAHAGQVVHQGNAVALQHGARPHAREHQQLRRQQRARAQQHLARGSAPAARSPPWRYSTPTARQPSIRTRVACAPVCTCRLGRDQVRREVALGGTVAFAVLVGRPGTGQRPPASAPVEVRVVRRSPPAPRRAQSSGSRGAARANPATFRGPPVAVQGAGAVLVVLGAQKIRQHIAPGPAGGRPALPSGRNPGADHGHKSWH